jgi:hypothetical protein
VTPAPAEGGAPPARRGPGRWVAWTFVAAALASGAGFGWKIHEFADDLLRDQGIGFAGAHLVAYAFVAAGFLLLLAGTFLRGHYADVEKAKFDMLEREIAHDAHDAHARARRRGPVGG